MAFKKKRNPRISSSPANLDGKSQNVKMYLSEITYGLQARYHSRRRRQSRLSRQLSDKTYDIARISGGFSTGGKFRNREREATAETSARTAVATTTVKRIYRLVGQPRRHWSQKVPRKPFLDVFQKLRKRDRGGGGRGLEQRRRW